MNNLHCRRFSVHAEQCVLQQRFVCNYGIVAAYLDIKVILVHLRDNLAPTHASDQACLTVQVSQ